MKLEKINFSLMILNNFELMLQTNWIFVTNGLSRLKSWDHSFLRILNKN